MWNVHWCHTATTRVGEIAVPMNVRSPPHPTSPHPPAEVQLLSPMMPVRPQATLTAARDSGVHIVFAPSDVTSFYTTHPSRKRTLGLPNVTLPPSKPKYSTIFSHLA